MQLLRIELADLAETQAIGSALGRSLPPGCVILLEGSLGTGKTSLVQGIGQGLGLTEPIASPTFTLINEYSDGRLPLYHLDLYRLQPAEVASLYLESYWDGLEFPLGIMAIEWAERLPYRPASYLHISLSATPDDRRCAEIEWVGNDRLAVLELLQSAVHPA